MIKLNAAQEDKAKSLMLDIWIRTRQTANTRVESYYGSYSGSLLGRSYEKYAVAAATTIMQAITRRTFNFKEVDAALESIKEYGFAFGNSTKSDKCEWKIRNVAGAAKFLAWICQQTKVYWNDIAYTASEREAFKSGSVFAYYLFEAECFVSQPTKVAKTRASRAVTGATTGATRTGAPKSGYKSAGPQSAYVAGLVGKPGEKETLSDPLMFCVLGEKAGTIVPKAFIHPVENPAVDEHAKLNSDGLPIVKFGAGNGYTDLAIFHPNIEVMKGIMAKLGERGAFSKYSGVYVAKAKNEGSYFKVNTEFGEVYVKPTKLNEELFESIFEAMSDTETDVELEEAAGYAISNMDQFVRDCKMYD
jgi:hypothetical protein